MPKLNQILAIEKGKKTQIYAEIQDLHKATQKRDLMEGHHKVYTPSNEEGERVAPDTRKVKYNHADVFATITSRLRVLFDVTASKDWANCDAKADVTVDGTVFLEQVPVTYLLFLEKQLTDLRTFVAKMAELDPGESWTLDPNTNLFRSEPIETAKTKKLQRAITLYDATEKHPAQCQLITEDCVIGHFTTTKFSGAIPAPKKRDMLERIDKLSDAVKFAKESANAMNTDQKQIGEKVLGFIFPTNGA